MSNNERHSKPNEHQAEELFRNDIVRYFIWIFIILVLTVLFYDKFFANK